MKYAIASLIIPLVFSAQAFAGAANAQIKCASADGKALLQGDVPGDFADFDITAEFQGKPMMKTNLYSRLNQKTDQQETNGRITIVEDLKNGVYTLQATDNQDQDMMLIRLYALPKTVKLRTFSAGYNSTFTGKLTVSSENGSEDVTVNCHLDYSI